MDTDATSPPPVGPPPAPTRGRPKKTFKACRTCRRQKMRCEGQAPCTRCQASGSACVFDVMGPKIRTSPDDREGESNPQQRQQQQQQQQQTRIQNLEAELLELRKHQATSGEVSSTEHRIRTPSESHAASEISASGDAGGAAGLNRSSSGTNNPYALNPDDLDAPVTVIHAMTPRTPRLHARHRGWDGDQMNLLPSITPPQDFISEGLLDEAVARELFNSFMTGSNTFLPMLDPVLDTFDSVRVRSPFCLAVVLATAARARETTNPADNVKQICHGEARRLAAETLFIGNPVLEDAQAMTILAAFSERTWFAVGHATQMAMVLRLQDALPQLLKGPRSIFTADTQRTARLLARQARTWLMILSIEWEIAAGTARPPRIQAIDAETLRAFATHPASNVSDSRIVSLLELIILRGQMQKEIEDSENSLSACAMTRVRSTCGRFDTWCAFWDKTFEDSGYPQSSFERTSLYMSREYAKTFTCCAALRKIQIISSLGGGSPATFGKATPDSVTLEILSYAMNVMYNQLSFLIQSPAYKWHLKWSPTYTALTIAFTCVLALKISKLKPELIDQSHLEPLVKEVARLLQTHPHPNFHHVIRLLMSVPQNLNNVVLYPAATREDYAMSGGGGELQYADNTSSDQGGSHLGIAVEYQPIYPQNGVQVDPSQQQAQDALYRGWLGNWSNLESSWLLDGTSIGSFGLPNNGNASVFDFDLPTGGIPGLSL